MKRKTNTLAAEYARRGLIRPNQATPGTVEAARKARPNDSEYLGALIEFFDWKGTTVWGVRS